GIPPGLALFWQADSLPRGKAQAGLTTVSRLEHVARRRSALAGGHQLGIHRELDDPEVVAERVAQAAVDAVRVLDRLLAELDALGFQGLVGFAAVRRGEAERETAPALGDRLANLSGRLLIHPGRSWDLEQDV